MPTADTTEGLDYQTRAFEARAERAARYQREAAREEQRLRDIEAEARQ